METKICKQLNWPTLSGEFENSPEDEEHANIWDSLSEAQGANERTYLEQIELDRLLSDRIEPRNSSTALVVEERISVESRFFSPDFSCDDTNKLSLGPLTSIGGIEDDFGPAEVLECSQGDDELGQTAWK